MFGPYRWYETARMFYFLVFAYLPYSDTNVGVSTQRYNMTYNRTVVMSDKVHQRFHSKNL
jgi:hypothetical protein